MTEEQLRLIEEEKKIGHLCITPKQTQGCPDFLDTGNKIEAFLNMNGQAKSSAHSLYASLVCSNDEEAKIYKKWEIIFRGSYDDIEGLSRTKESFIEHADRLVASIPCIIGYRKEMHYTRLLSQRVQQHPIYGVIYINLKVFFEELDKYGINWDFHESTPLIGHEYDGYLDNAPIEFVFSYSREKTNGHQYTNKKNK